MSESKDNGISRRDFIKAAAKATGIGLGTVGVVKLGEAAGEGIQGVIDARNLENEHTLEEFVGGKELFNGLHAYVNGVAVLPKGTTIYSEPRVWRETKPEWPFTTTADKDTKIGEVEEERLIINHPFLVLREADKMSNAAHVIQLTNPDNPKEKKKVDIERSFLVFSIGDQNLSPDVKNSVKSNPYKVGCVSLRENSLQFVDNDSNTSFELPASIITFKKELRIY